MDKKGERMSRKIVLLFGLTIFIISASGCNTVYRASKGAAEGAASGAKQDWTDAQKGDAWMRKNLW
jgi:uncharacterized protein YceK